MSLIAAGAMAALSVAPTAYGAGPRQVADTFTATTADSVKPAGTKLRMQILSWQEADARSEAVATLAAGSEAATPLAKLPTVGYVWPDGSPVGYSVKYTHREPAAGGGERITLVTDRRLGSFDFKGWSVPGTGVAMELPYSVIVLDVDASGSGTGTFVLGGDVMLDETGGTVALPAGAATGLLTNVKRETSAH